MRKFLLCLFCVLFCSPALAAAPLTNSTSQEDAQDKSEPVGGKNTGFMPTLPPKNGVGRLTVADIRRLEAMQEEVDAAKREEIRRIAALFPKNADGYPKVVVPGVGIVWKSREKNFGGGTLPKELMVFPPVVEDPNWYYPAPGSGATKPEYAHYSLGLGSDYLTILEEALSGNPVAMVDLMIQAEMYPDKLARAFPSFPPQAHTKKFWQDWAIRYTSPGWIYARLATYDRLPSAYREGADLGDPQCMYEYARATGRDYIPWQSLAADAGWGPAAHKLSKLYRYSVEVDEHYGYDELPKNLEKAKYYLNIAQQHGEKWPFLDVACDALVGAFGIPADLETAYMYCYIFHVLANTEKGLLLIDRQLGLFEDISPELFGVWTYNVPDLPNEFEEAKAFQRKRADAKERTNNFSITKEQNTRAKQRALNWLLQYQAKRQAELDAYRERRALLTQELRTELAPAVLLLHERKEAQREAEAKQAHEEKMRELYKKLALPVSFGIFVLLLLLVGLFKALRKPRTPSG